MISRAFFLAVPCAALLAHGGQIAQPAFTWVKRSLLPGSPPSPRLGYEGACRLDSAHHLVIRYGGHNPGGGGEQNAEVRTFDLPSAPWTLKEPKKFYESFVAVWHQ